MNQRELLAVLEDGWRQLDAAVAGLDEAAMAEPGVVGDWSVKDVLGHVTAWELVALRHIEAWRAGDSLDFQQGTSVDAYNAAEVARRRQMFLSEVRGEMAETRARLRAAIESLADDEWQAPVTVGPHSGTLGQCVGSDLGGDGPGQHAAEHVRHILAWRAATGR